MKIWTESDVRHRFPKATADQVAAVTRLLNAKGADIRQIWAGEDQRAEEPQQLGDDGLTDAMRAVNAFAEENALGLPFPPKR